MPRSSQDLRGCPTAYDCRERLPALTSWMSDDDLKLIPIWDRPRFEAGQSYVDLDNPRRGAFVASGDEGAITDHTYACHAETPERVWAKLITWAQLSSTDQVQALDRTTQAFGIEPEQ
jgi:hypothetical protein